VKLFLSEPSGLPYPSKRLPSSCKGDSREHNVTTLAGSNKIYDLHQGDVLDEMSLIDVKPAISWLFLYGYL
jgi:hypothetical protein